MGVDSVLIVDENYEDLHKACIGLEGYGFRIVISDNVSDVLDFLKIREIPQVIFLSETIKDRSLLFRSVKQNKSVQIISIFPTKDSQNRTTPCICKPYSSSDFLQIIKELD